MPLLLLLLLLLSPQKEIPAAAAAAKSCFTDTAAAPVTHNREVHTKNPITPVVASPAQLLQWLLPSSPPSPAAAAVSFDTPQAASLGHRRLVTRLARHLPPLLLLLSPILTSQHPTGCTVGTQRFSNPPG